DYDYNSRGWLIKETSSDPDGAGPLGRPEKTFGYDATGNVTTEGSYQWTAGASVTHTYDDAGHRLSTSGPVAGATTYFIVGGLRQVLTVTDAVSNSTNYQYDFRGQVTKIIGHDQDGSGPNPGPTLQQNTYDPAGQLSTTVDARGN